MNALTRCLPSAGAPLAGDAEASRPARATAAAATPRTSSSAPAEAASPVPLVSEISTRRIAGMGACFRGGYTASRASGDSALCWSQTTAKGHAKTSSSSAPSTRGPIVPRRPTGPAPPHAKRVVSPQPNARQVCERLEDRGWPSSTALRYEWSRYDATVAGGTFMPCCTCTRVDSRASVPPAAAA